MNAISARLPFPLDATPEPSRLATSQAPVSMPQGDQSLWSLPELIHQVYKEAIADASQERQMSQLEKELAEQGSSNAISKAAWSDWRFLKLR